MQEMKNIQWISSPWGFRETPLARQCEWLKEHDIGYICGHFSRELRGAIDPEISDEEIKEVIKLVKGYGLEYASFNTDGDFMVLKGVEDEIALSCSRIDRAAKFSPKVIIVFAGWQDRSDTKVYGQVADALKQVSRHAAKYNLRVALENHGGLTTHAEQVNKILDAVHEPNIGVNFDPANFLMYGEDPYKALQELKHPLFFTHFKSVKRVNGRKVYCRLSEGEIDYCPILEFLDKRYDGFYGLEYEETSDVELGSEDDFKWLKKCLSIVSKSK